MVAGPAATRSAGADLALCDDLYQQAERVSQSAKSTRHTVPRCRGAIRELQLRVCTPKLGLFGTLGHLNRVQFENHSPARLGQRMCLPYRDPD
jgi:hypothetical protein